jgi:hypothetical protein
VIVRSQRNLIHSTAPSHKGQALFGGHDGLDWTIRRDAGTIVTTMRIALMHYHLRPGGVTTVLRDQYRALAAEHECIMLSGEPLEEGADPSWRAAIRVVPGIGYSGEGRASADPALMAEGIRDAMTAAWGGTADILHVHNPTLNKNPGLLSCLRILQGKGMRVLAQVHDLAEEGRPASAYPPDEEYPSDCHYGVINSRDRDALVSAGLSPGGVHLMFNRVRDVGCDAQPRPETLPRRLLYPVRAIRRKNIGEALLIGVLLDAEVAVTLPPRNRADLARYESWRNFAGEKGLRARFDAGLSEPLGALMAGSGVAVTTSVNEGFGFAFLEPWTAGLAVVGRRVPHVCRDFESGGMRLPHLYASLPVKTVYFDESALAGRWRAAVRRTFLGFSREADEGALAEAWSEKVRGGAIDFAFLDEEAQRQVIARVLSDKAARRVVAEGFPALNAIVETLARPDHALVDANRTIVLDAYGSSSYARLLSRIYERVGTVPVHHAIDRRRLLDGFLEPGKLRMIEVR